ncbi:MAG TPA: hypothetical protein PLQ50_00980 [Candidatus Woesebacteria bacterium]|jgi:threonine/homoserine/homoserine lactone efflux protein|nr:hypothetical protein [Candidatus Woesebacteria bacterium]
MHIIEQAYAQTREWSSIPGGSGCVVGDVATIQGVGCLVANVLSVILSVLGVVGFIMIIYAGFNLLLNGGNSQATKKSKDIVTYAIIGIVLALCSFIIVNLIAEFTGIDAIKRFTMPNSSTS